MRARLGVEEDQCVIYERVVVVTTLTAYLIVIYNPLAHADGYILLSCARLYEPEKS